MMTHRITFLDFESSSLSESSYPIEVGWVTHNNGVDTPHSLLIKPADDWQNWNPDAEKIHGISREQLLRDGIPIIDVMKTLMEDVGDYIFATSSMDSYWFWKLARKAHELGYISPRVKKVDLYDFRFYMQWLATISPEGFLCLELAVDSAKKKYPITHRALQDALHIHYEWMEMHKQIERSPENLHKGVLAELRFSAAFPDDEEFMV